MRLCGLLLALCAIAIGSASAQTPAGGQLRGRAVDQSGLVMPGAGVSLINDVSRDTRRAVGRSVVRLFGFEPDPAHDVSIPSRTEAHDDCRLRVDATGVVRAGFIPY